jgi:hypothetical protein
VPFDGHLASMGSVFRVLGWVAPPSSPFDRSVDDDIYDYCFRG